MEGTRRGWGEGGRGAGGGGGGTVAVHAASQYYDSCRGYCVILQRSLS